MRYKIRTPREKSELRNINSHLAKILISCHSDIYLFIQNVLFISDSFNSILNLIKEKSQL